MIYALNHSRKLKHDIHPIKLPDGKYISYSHDQKKYDWYKDFKLSFETLKSIDSTLLSQAYSTSLVIFLTSLLLATYGLNSLFSIKMRASFLYLLMLCCLILTFQFKVGDVSKVLMRK